MNRSPQVEQVRVSRVGDSIFIRNAFARRAAGFQAQSGSSVAPLRSSGRIQWLPEA